MNFLKPLMFWIVGSILFSLTFFTPTTYSEVAPNEIIIFKNGQLAPGWQDWSWQSTLSGTQVSSEKWGAVHFRYPEGFNITDIEYVRVIHTGHIQTGLLVDKTTLPVMPADDSFTHLIYHFIDKSEHTSIDGLFLQSFEAGTYELQKVSFVLKEGAVSTAIPSTETPATSTPAATAPSTMTPSVMTPSPTSTSAVTPTSPAATQQPTQTPEPTSTNTPPPATATPEPAAEPITTGNVFYVSKLGNNSDGRSWGTAWNELANINWNSLNAGDVIYVDGGTTQMRYTTSLKPAKSGTADKPILVRLSAENGRDGQAIFFGGNSVPLPECGQLSWNDSELKSAGESAIIFENGIANIEISGRKTHGIVIHGWQSNGVTFRNDFSNNGIDDAAKNITLEYMEIYNNGGTRRQDDGSSKNLWFPNHAGSGVKLAGSGHHFNFLEIHDNGGDAIQSSATNLSKGVDNQLANFTLTNSWLYNQRPHSGVDNSPAGEVCSADRSSACDELGAPHMGPDYHTYPSDPPNRRESFNWCTHSDGIQIFSGGAFNKMTIERSIIGPNFMTALILGDKKSGDVSAWVNDLTLQDVVITRYMHNALGMNNPSNNPGRNWNIDHVTLYGHHNNTNKGTFHIESGQNFVEHSVSNSILVHGRTNFPDGNIRFANNCQWGLYSGSIDGTITDPQFSSIFENDLFEADLSVDFATKFSDNYQVQNPNCAGSRITSPWDIR